MFIVPLFAIGAFVFLAYQAVADLHPATEAAPPSVDIIARVAADRLNRGEIDREEYDHIVRLMRS